MLITLLSGNAAAENNRPNDSFSDSLLATQLSKEPNAMADYRLPVIYEMVTIIVAEIKIFLNNKIHKCLSIKAFSPCLYIILEIWKLTHL